MKLTCVDNFHFLLEHNIDYNAKTFLFSDEISDESLKVMRNALQVFKGAPFTIQLNSGGGDVVAGLAMYDLIKQHGEVTMVITGAAISMAAIIFQAAKYRFVSENSTMMIHQGHIEPPYDLSRNIKSYIKWSDNLDIINDRILLDRIHEKIPSMSWARLRKTTQFDSYLTASQIVALGLADGVLIK